MTSIEDVLLLIERDTAKVPVSVFAYRDFISGSCPHCGQRLFDDKPFCDKCGQRIGWKLLTKENIQYYECTAAERRFDQTYVPPHTDADAPMEVADDAVQVQVEIECHENQ